MSDLSFFTYYATNLTEMLSNFPKCWAGCCECATAVQFFKVTELLCLVGNKSDSSGK